MSILPRRVKKRRWHYIIAIVLILFIIVLLLKNPFLQWMADYLYVEEKLEAADVLIVLGGESEGERTERAVQLMNRDMRISCCCQMARHCPGGPLL